MLLVLENVVIKDSEMIFLHSASGPTIVEQASPAHMFQIASINVANRFLVADQVVRLRNNQFNVQTLRKLLCILVTLTEYTLN